MLRFCVKSSHSIFPLLSFGNVLKGRPPLVFEGLSKSPRRPDNRFISRRTIASQDGVKKRNRPPGGARMLTDPSLVYMFNNWDNVEWDETQEQEARTKVEDNSRNKLPLDDQEKYETKSGHYWNEFYAQHQNRFFKDRHWLFTEFPELAPLYEEKTTGDVSDMNPEEEKVGFPGEHAAYRIFEVGCGVGNTVFPILQTSNDPNLFVYCCDLSANAIQLVKENSEYNERRCHAFVGDVSDPSISLPFPAECVDIIVLIFVLSAINPEKLSATIQRLSKLLKPGGLIVFRDYGRYDLTQLRFKAGRCLADNFYVRGDGTKVYYFTQEELRTLFTEAGLNEEQNLIDRRLQVNRCRQLKMYRVWIQCKYRKPKVVQS